MFPKLEMLNPKKAHLYGYVCDSVEWTCFDVRFVVKVGFGLRKSRP